MFSSGVKCKSCGFVAHSSCAKGIVAGCGEVQQVVPPSDPTGPAVFPAVLNAERYHTHIQIDKPIYHPGDTVYFRAVVLNALNHRPLLEKEESRFVKAKITLKSPGGDDVFSGMHPGPVITQNSVVAGSWTIPSEQPGGDYKLKVEWPHYNDFTSGEKEFNIRTFRPPRLNSQLEFVRKGYGPGDFASCTLDCKRAEGGVPEGARVTAIARIDGEECHRDDSLRIDSKGLCTVAFRLPDTIEEGIGTLTCSIEDGGVVETASKTIPILLQCMKVDCYPEGGELTLGLECGLYVEAFTPVGDPADIVAEIVDSSNESVAGTVTTLHEGRGCCSFRPKSTSEHYLRIVNPTGITKPVKLPAIKSEGVSLRSCQKVYNSNEDADFVVSSTSAGTFVLVLYKKDMEIGRTEIKLNVVEEKKVEVPKLPGVDGVLRVTLFNSDVGFSMPLAERLVFASPSSVLQTKVVCNKPSYVPGGEVWIEVTVTDNGEPVEDSVVGVSVTDRSVLEMVEKRKWDPRLNAKVFLEQEVDHLEDSHVYLSQHSDDKSKADSAVDLLLGTQGWRRFVFYTQETFLDEKKEIAERVLALHKSIPDISNIRRRAMRRNDAPGGPPPMPMAVMGGAPIPMGMPMPPPSSALAGPQLQAPLPSASLAAPAAAPRVAAGPPSPAFKSVAKKEMQEAPQLARRGAKKEMEAAPRMMMAKKKRVLARDRLAPTPHSPVAPVKYVREYAHALRLNRVPGTREDFTETLCWIPTLKTNKQGIARFSFHLSDSVTSFLCFADAFCASGWIGLGEVTVESKEPFYLEPKMPLELTTGDRVVLPVAIVNGTSEELSAILNTTVEEKCKEMLSMDPAPIKKALKAEERGRVTVPFTVKDGAHGNIPLLLSAEAAPYSDNVTRATKVIPTGFPFQLAGAGMINEDSTVTHNFRIPEDYVAGSVVASCKVFPSGASSLFDSLKGMIRMPCGCFEQTSSSNYPMIMALSFFAGHPEKSLEPDLVVQAQECLDAGYKRLTGFECQKVGGYDWFGSEPPHEALTAMGILQFTEMKKVYDGVSSQMVERTLKWLMSRKKSGGFQLNKNHCHSWSSEPGAITDAYICYALSEAGLRDEIRGEVESLLKRENKWKADPYIKALLSLSLHNLGMNDAYVMVSEALFQHISKSGAVEGAPTTIVQSGGNSLLVETTSLCMLSWMRQGTKYREQVDQCYNFLINQSKGGRYGSTQATVLGLKAIIEYDKHFSTPESGGAVRLIVDDETIETVTFGRDTTSNSLKFRDFSEVIVAGDHVVKLSMEKGSKMNYCVDVEYHAITPDTSPLCDVGLETYLRSSKIRESEGTEIEAFLVNKKEEPIPMTLAVIGLPGGLELRHEKLKELVKSKVIDYYEVMGARSLVIYKRYMMPKEQVKIAIDVVAAVPGEYTGFASCAYLYYTDEYRVWIPGLTVTIDAI